MPRLHLWSQPGRLTTDQLPAMRTLDQHMQDVEMSRRSFAVNVVPDVDFAFDQRRLPYTRTVESVKSMASTTAFPFATACRTSALVSFFPFEWL